ncbi:MAG: sugar phosphate isomerase/epimerase [Verrucomicrobia bacterium]|nr:sugar phosphate isomerase/epimerase [Verrucomicrobiota bacterium]
MQLGIFAKTFVRPTLGETLDAVVHHGLDCIQFNFSCVGLPTLPEQIDAALTDQIRRELATRRLTMSAVSGTCNLIHPDLQKRRDGLRRLKVLITAARQLGTSSPSRMEISKEINQPLTRPPVTLSPSEGERGGVRGRSVGWKESHSQQSPVITLCTGTRDPEDMWRRHPDNDSPEAWRELLASLSDVLPVAQTNDVTLAFEPEVSNVVDSARKGRQLLDELKSPNLKVVMDGANLFHAGELPRMKGILTEAFDFLGPNIVIAHAKDLSRDGEMGNVAAGKGLLDYDLYLSLLDGVGFSGPLILHGMEEKEVPEGVAFLRGKTEIMK